jgi:hypothetical protein
MRELFLIMGLGVLLKKTAGEGILRKITPARY